MRMEDRTGVSSLGAIVPGDARPGAQIAILAGVGAQGANYNGLLARYLTLDNQAQAGIPLTDQPGRVVKTYQDELFSWLSDAAKERQSVGEGKSVYVQVDHGGRR